MTRVRWRLRFRQALEAAWRRPDRGAPSPFRAAIGVGLLALGMIGLLLPVVPGWPFLIAGTLLLGREHRFVKPFLHWIDRWHRKNPP